MHTCAGVFSESQDKEYLLQWVEEKFKMFAKPRSRTTRSFIVIVPRGKESWMESFSNTHFDSFLVGGFGGGDSTKAEDNNLCSGRANDIQVKKSKSW